jgi:hypothetical protein
MRKYQKITHQLTQILAQIIIVIIIIVVVVVFIIIIIIVIIIIIITIIILLLIKNYLQQLFGHISLDGPILVIKNRVIYFTN